MQGLLSVMESWTEGSKFGCDVISLCLRIVSHSGLKRGTRLVGEMRPREG